MAIGFGNIDNFQETIQTTIDNGIGFARSQLSEVESEYCIDCGNKIPLKRREIMKVCRCVFCQEKHDKQYKETYNRRGSKDSQLR